MRNKEYALGIDSMCHQLNNFSKVWTIHGLNFFSLKVFIIISTERRPTPDIPQKSGTTGLAPIASRDSIQRSLGQTDASPIGTGAGATEARALCRACSSTRASSATTPRCATRSAGPRRRPPRCSARSPSAPRPCRCCRVSRCRPFRSADPSPLARR